MAIDRSIAKQLKSLGYIAIGFFCFLLVPSQYAFGQVDEGSITGTVQDSTGAAVPNALVTLLNMDQGTTQQTKTNSTGGYTFSPVKIGHYNACLLYTSSPPAVRRGPDRQARTSVSPRCSQGLKVRIALRRCRRGCWRTRRFEHSRARCDPSGPVR